MREAIVVAREDRPGEKRLVAYYAGQDGIGAEELRAHLAAALPDYMVPAAYVRLAGLPLTPNGKLDRQALPAPEGDAYARAATRRPLARPRRCWPRSGRSCSGVERVGRHDNFFELGGHSLLAVKLLSVLKQMNVNISLAKILAYPTIEGLSRDVGVRWELLLKLGAIPLRRTGNQPPLFLLPEASGEMFYGAYLTKYLTIDLPVYGFSFIQVREAPMRTVEAMALDLRHVIRTIQPKGPYRLAGWSLGVSSPTKLLRY